MTADLPAHVLRLERAPVVAALSHFSTGTTVRATKATNAQEPQAQLKPYNEHGWRTEAEFAARLEGCTICRGLRVCPECGGPCDCTIVTR